MFWCIGEASVSPPISCETAWHGAEHEKFLLYCTGHLDASLRLRNSLFQPVLGGDVRLSKGTAMLVPQGAGADSGRTLEARKEDDLVQKAFGVLTQKQGLQEQPEEPQVSTTSA